MKFVFVVSMTECLQSRFLDADKEPLKTLSPIIDYEKSELVPLASAIIPLEDHIPGLSDMARKAKRNVNKGSDAITPDESAAIGLYTMENVPNNVYTTLNQALRSEQHSRLRPWFFFLKLLLTALDKLPSKNGLVWRGIRRDVSNKYEIGAHIVWWGFSSCIESLSQTRQFVGKQGQRTIFSIQCINGKMIQEYSWHPIEGEILLMPGTYLKVKDKMNLADGLHIINLEEVTPSPIFIVPPFSQIYLASASNSRSMI